MTSEPFTKQMCQIITEVYTFEIELLHPLQEQYLSSIGAGDRALLDQMQSNVEERGVRSFQESYATDEQRVYVIAGMLEQVQVLIAGMKIRAVTGIDVISTLMSLGMVVVSNAKGFYSKCGIEEWSSLDRLDNELKGE
jgi:hypothetical protein